PALWVGAAPLTPEDAFTAAPASVFPLLDRNSRLDMVDYFRSGLSTPTPNRLDGRSAVTAITPASLSLKLSEVSTAQLVLLPERGDTIIALVTTMSVPGRDSSIAFYSSEWEPLPAVRYFKIPSLADWTAKGHRVSEIEQAVPFMLSAIDIDPDSGTLTLSNTLSAFVAPEVYGQVSAALLPSITYRWDGKRFAR
ncbi:MAG: DUF3256 family protein, partial [Duncaniella sp.]|nr:DUF3256 family protein [Duncaniella sp.]